MDLNCEEGDPAVHKYHHQTTWERVGGGGVDQDLPTDMFVGATLSAASGWESTTRGGLAQR